MGAMHNDLRVETIKFIHEPSIQELQVECMLLKRYLHFLCLHDAHPQLMICEQKSKAWFKVMNFTAQVIQSHLECFECVFARDIRKFVVVFMSRFK